MGKRKAFFFNKIKISPIEKVANDSISIINFEITHG